MKSLSLLLGLAVLVPAAAHAQVQIHPAALAQLAGISPSPPARAAHPPVHRAAQRLVRHARRPTKPAALPVPPPPAPGAAPGSTPATAAPAVTPAVAKPVTMPPKALGTPPPPVIPPPLTIRFAPGSAALPPQAQAALQAFCKTPAKLGIDAKAAGDPNDPSVAMRLSLARALAVRDALTACGVNSTRIIPRALGSAAGGPENIADNEAVLAAEGARK